MAHAQPVHPSKRPSRYSFSEKAMSLLSEKQFLALQEDKRVALSRRDVLALVVAQTGLMIDDDKTLASLLDCLSALLASKKVRLTIEGSHSL